MEHRITDQPAFLLHCRSWQNSGLILDLFTPDHGRLSLLARAAKSGRSRGILQPFCKLTVSWSGRHELKQLTAVEGHLLPLAERLYLPLLYVNELIAAYLPKFESSPELFALYETLLHRIDSCNLEPQLREFERSAMQILGYFPDIFVDADRGEAIESEAFYCFQVTQGFRACHAGQPGAIKGCEIVAWNQSRYTEPSVQRMAKAVMRDIIDFNLHGKKLKSRDIYSQMHRRT